MTNKNEELQERCLDIFMREIHSTKHQIQKIPMVLNKIIQETKDSMGSVDLDRLHSDVEFMIMNKLRARQGSCTELSMDIVKHILSQSPHQTKE